MNPPIIPNTNNGIGVGAGTDTVTAASPFSLAAAPRVAIWGAGGLGAVHRGQNTMMLIRKTQMDALIQARVRDFADRMVRYLRSSFPEKTAHLTDAELDALVRRGIVDAKGYDIVRECDVAKYIEVAIQLPSDFEQDPKTDWVAAVLRDPKLSAEEKLERLEEECRALGGKEP